MFLHKRCFLRFRLSFTIVSAIYSWDFTLFCKIVFNYLHSCFSLLNVTEASIQFIAMNSFGNGEEFRCPFSLVCRMCCAGLFMALSEIYLSCPDFCDVFYITCVFCTFPFFEDDTDIFYLILAGVQVLIAATLFNHIYVACNNGMQGIKRCGRGDRQCSSTEYLFGTLRKIIS